MMPQSTSGLGRNLPRWLLTVTLIFAPAMLAGCSASTISEHLPTAAGGLPPGAPPRPETPPAYPAVHDRPPERNDVMLTADEQRKLEDELAAVRARAGAAASKPPAGAARNP